MGGSRILAQLGRVGKKSHFLLSPCNTHLNNIFVDDLLDSATPMLPLAEIDSNLRLLLPANLYTLSWLDPSSANLLQAFEHLRSLSHILHDYVPPSIATRPPKMGYCRYSWQQGTLLFTDLAGFTPLMESYFAQGERDGAIALLEILNRYFGMIVAIVSKSGGNLLEFTGDALLVEFPQDKERQDLARAVRAGLRMQRAMTNFANIATAQGCLSLQMRVGIHAGRFLSTDVGTPIRMMRVLLGDDVQRAKRAEGAGKVGRVCVTTQTSPLLEEQFEFETHTPGYQLVVDNLSDAALGEYDIARQRRRLRRSILIDRSEAQLSREIQSLVQQIMPVASYLPPSVLKLAVASVSQRQIPPQFVTPTVVFINLIGLSQAVEDAAQDEIETLVRQCNTLFALINGVVVEAEGVMRNPTYNLDDPDIMLYFGMTSHYADEVLRSVQTAIAIRDLVANFPPLQVRGKTHTLTCQIGIARGLVFAAEIGEPRGRREFNLLSDTVNVAARLMSSAPPNQILISSKVHSALQMETPAQDWTFRNLGAIALKGKSQQMAVYTVAETTPETALPATSTR